MALPLPRHPEAILVALALPASSSVPKLADFSFHLRCNMAGSHRQEYFAHVVQVLTDHVVPELLPVLV